MISKKVGGALQRVLVVDDRPAICSMLERVLEKAGFDVCAATDGCSALGMAKSEMPEVAIVDCSLPGRMSGLQLLDALKQISPTTKCVLMSGSSEAVSALERAGVDAFLEKPFDVVTVVDLVNSLLGTHSNHEERRGAPRR
ncbi:MAG TPA: response regulator [Firmicutes bacterium]|nr:response regulator [Bacillota bacterium]